MKKERLLGNLDQIKKAVADGNYDGYECTLIEEIIELVEQLDEFVQFVPYYYPYNSYPWWYQSGWYLPPTGYGINISGGANTANLDAQSNTTNIGGVIVTEDESLPGPNDWGIKMGGDWASWSVEKN